MTVPGETLSSRKLTVDAELEKLQHDSFKYFLHETNPANGLVIDKTEAGWPASIAATGLALASYPVAVERGYGFKASFNPTYPAASGNPHGWVSPWHFGLNEGPTILMIENYRTGLLWRLMRNCPYIVGGLRRAGFGGGWVSCIE
jgi:hypothetical protein